MRIRISSPQADTGKQQHNSSNQKACCEVDGAPRGLCTCLAIDSEVLRDTRLLM